VESAGSAGGQVTRRGVRLPPLELAGDLQVPDHARGLVIFAHGSGSSRLSPRNRAVADDLNRRGLATLLFDLLGEREAADRAKVFDIVLLADRLLHAVRWFGRPGRAGAAAVGPVRGQHRRGGGPGGGGQTRARVAAVVSRGGRPDLAGPA